MNITPYVIEMHELSKTYKYVDALKPLNLRLQQNSIFGFLGPNGAGKTTTIKLLLGLIRPTAGSATLFGMDSVSQSLDIRARIGYLPQEARFHEYMTARQTLRFVARFFFKGPKKAIEERIEEMLELVCLTDKADRPIRTFTGGERQRLGIAQAQVNYPDLLNQLAFLCRAPFCTNDRGMSFSMADDRFRPRPDDLHQPLQLPGGQRQHDLHRHILAPAKCTADRRIDDAHIFVGQVERMSDLVAVFMGPLPAAFHGDASLLVEISQPGFRLQVGMLLDRGAVFGLDDHIRPGKPFLHAALADLVMDADDGIADVLVDARRFRLHRLLGIQDERQVLITDLDQSFTAAAACASVSATTTATWSPMKKDVADLKNYLLVFDQKAKELTAQSNELNFIVAEMKKSLPPRSQLDLLITRNIQMKYLPQGNQSQPKAK